MYQQLRAPITATAPRNVIILLFIRFACRRVQFMLSAPVYNWPRDIFTHKYLFLLFLLCAWPFIYSFMRNTHWQKFNLSKNILWRKMVQPVKRNGDDDVPENLFIFCVHKNFWCFSFRSVWLLWWLFFFSLTSFRLSILSTHLQPQFHSIIHAISSQSHQYAEWGNEI